MLPIDRGEVLAHGRPLTPRDRAGLLFYLPDAIVPWPAQTVRWALDFTTGFFGGRRESVDEVVDRFDLQKVLGSTMGTLSKGQRKRTLLAIGLLVPQPIVMADEPFDGLDLRQSRDVAQTLREYAAQGRTIVLSIHQIADAARVCDRFVLLSGGRVCGEGTLDELSTRAAARHPERATFSGNLEEVFLALT